MVGSYTFKWEHPANEVYVTGTFDDWGKTVKLEKEDGVFRKTVELPKEKVQYKFVVDGNWVTNDSAPGENDNANNYNNILLPDDIKEASEHALFSAVPKENKSGESLPGAFPETPANEVQSFSVNPIPATEGPGNPINLAPGEKVPDPSTFTSNTIESTVKHDKEPEDEEAKTLSINPLPATAGAGNPIHLEPGEKVPDPSTFTSNTISSTVKTDPESYENSNALPPQLGPVVTPDAERQANGGMFGLPAIAKNLIPESSLPMGGSSAEEKDPGVTIQSVHPSSTTAALAGQVPKEPRGVPETVTQSQKEANFAPEASANPEAVQEKKEVEQELKNKVPEEPPAAEDSYTEKATATAAGGAAAFAGATYAAKDAASKTLGLNEQTSTGPSIDDTKKELIPTRPAVGVPEEVKESQQEAEVAPEAAANPEAVAEKAAVESELLKEIKPTNETGEPAPTITAATTATAPKGTYLNYQSEPASEVPEPVKDSQEEAKVAPEASANPEAVAEKAAVESELLKEVKTTNEAGEPAPTITAETSETAPSLSPNALADTKPLKSSSEPDVLNAGADEPAVPPTTTVVQPTTPAKAPAATDSRDISPKNTADGKPAVTTGATSSTTEPKTEATSTPAPETPKKTTAPESSKGTPESIAESSNTDKKKKKRLSFFGKIKDKLGKH